MLFARTYITMAKVSTGQYNMPRFKLKRRTASASLAKRSRKPVQTTSAIDWLELWDLIAAGHSVAEICSSKEGFPPAHKVHLAIAASPELLERYKLARKAAVMAISEELLPIADELGEDEHVQRSRLRIDTRLKLLEALQPETFGKKLDLSNKDGSLSSAWSTAMNVVNSEKRGATKH